MTNLYLVGVHALNATPSDALLVPEGAFDAEDFMSVMLFDYGERNTPLDVPRRSRRTRLGRFARTATVSGAGASTRGYGVCAGTSCSGTVPR